MILLQILDIKSTMAHLLIRESFDRFFLENAEVVTFASLNVRGRRNEGWYDEEEKEEKQTEWIYWKEIKPLIFEYIKGQKTPSVLKVSLKADRHMAEQMLKNSGVWERYLADQPDLMLQLRYEKGMLSAVTGISYREFTMDKQIEFAWDKAVQQFFRTLGVGMELS